jgi:hypothetical protein
VLHNDQLGHLFDYKMAKKDEDTETSACRRREGRQRKDKGCYGAKSAINEEINWMYELCLD